MIKFTNEDKKAIRKILEKAINTESISAVIDLYNEEMFCNNVTYGFVDYAYNFTDRVNQLTKNGSSFPFRFDSNLELWKNDYIWTDESEVIYGGDENDFLAILLDDSFVGCIIDNLNEYNGDSISCYFDYKPLQDWLDSKINWTNIINNGDVIVFRNGLNAVYVDKTIMDNNIIGRIAYGEEVKIWTIEDFNADGTNKVNSNYSIDDIVDVVSRNSKWFM